MVPTCATPTPPRSSSSIPTSRNPSKSIRCICSKRCRATSRGFVRSTTRRPRPNRSPRSRCTAGEARMFRAASEPLVLLAQPQVKRGSKSADKKAVNEAVSNRPRGDRKRDAFGRSRALSGEADRRRGGGSPGRDLRRRPRQDRGRCPVARRRRNRLARSADGPGPAARQRPVDDAHSARSRRTSRVHGDRRGATISRRSSITCRRS